VCADLPLCCATGTLIPDKQLWAGNPAVYVRDVTDQEMAGFVKVRVPV
jgi:hypothetical protein